MCRLGAATSLSGVRSPPTAGSHSRADTMHGHIYSRLEERAAEEAARQVEEAAIQALPLPPLPPSPRPPDWVPSRLARQHWQRHAGPPLWKRLLPPPWNARVTKYSLAGGADSRGEGSGGVARGHGG
jgi:hypothetical protein